jgi:hypothetical protein
MLLGRGRSLLRFSPHRGPGMPHGLVRDRAAAGALARHLVAYPAGLPENVLRSGPLERIAIRREQVTRTPRDVLPRRNLPRSLTPDRSKHRRRQRATADYPPERASGFPVGSRVLPHPPVVPSNGRAPEVGRRAPPRRSATAKVARDVDRCLPRCRTVTSSAAGQRSTPTAAPPRASAAARCPLG